jgi:hypothetical protein
MSDRLTESLRELAAMHVALPPLDAVRRRRDIRRRRRVAAAAGAVAGVVALGGVGYAMSTAPTDRPAAPSALTRPPDPSGVMASGRVGPGDVLSEIPSDAMLRGADLPAGFHAVGRDDVRIGRTQALPRWRDCLTDRTSSAQPWNSGVTGERTRTLVNGSVAVAEVVRQYRSDLTLAPLFARLRQSVASCPTHAWTRVPAHAFAGQGSVLATTVDGATIALFFENTTVVAVTVEGLDVVDGTAFAKHTATRAAGEVCVIDGGSCD